MATQLHPFVLQSFFRFTAASERDEEGGLNAICTGCFLWVVLGLFCVLLVYEISAMPRYFTVLRNTSRTSVYLSLLRHCAIALGTCVVCTHYTSSHAITLFLLFRGLGAGAGEDGYTVLGLRGRQRAAVHVAHQLRQIPHPAGEKASKRTQQKECCVLLCSLTFSKSCFPYL